MTVSVTPCGSATAAPEASPDTATSRLAVSTLSFTAVSVTVPVLAVRPFAMVSTLFADRVTGDPFGTLTVIVTFSQVAADRLAVTVALFPVPLSLMVADESASSAVGVASSSVMVPLAAPAPSVLESVALVSVPRVTVIVSLSSSAVSPFTLMTMLALVFPAEMVTVLLCGSS